MATTERYRPYRKHPELFGNNFREEWLHPEMQLLVRKFERIDGNGAPLDLKDLHPLLRLETEEVYSFRCLSAPFLSMFNEEIQNFYAASSKYGIPVQRPNSMNNYGVIVNAIGMRPMVTSLQQTYVWPVARHLFPAQGSAFDDHHSFIVRYRSDEDPGLDMHVDDSDVTFNVCLGRSFTGATLTFCGNFGRPDHRRRAHSYRHEIGRAVLHLGSRRHGAEDIVSGVRANLIVWNRNLEWRRSEEYRRSRTTMYEKEEGPPDPVCLSYTHDRDYLFYRELPESKKGQAFHPWCPPKGFEYDEFDEKRYKHSAGNEL